MRYAAVEMRTMNAAIAVCEIGFDSITLIEAGVVGLTELAKVDLGEEICLVAPADVCHHTTEGVHAGLDLPSLVNFASIVSQKQTRPGGDRRAVVADRRDDSVQVGIANVDGLQKWIELFRMASSFQGRLAVADPAAAWIAAAEAFKRELPDVLVDAWCPTPSLLAFDAERSVLGTRLETLSGDSTQGRAAAATAHVRALMPTAAPKSIGVLCHTNEDLKAYVAQLSPLEVKVEPLWGGAAQPWTAAFGAIIAAHNPGTRYQEATFA